jgi:transcriptional regulator with XRE-family HTH domain
MYKEEEMENFSDRINLIRLNLRLSQQEFADNLNRTRQQISDIEDGKLNAGHDFFFLLVKKYDIEPEYLISGTGPMFKSSLRERDRELVLPGEFDDASKKFLDLFLHSDFFRYSVIGFGHKLERDNQDIIAREILHNK